MNKEWEIFFSNEIKYFSSSLYYDGFKGGRERNNIRKKNQ
jgi:hypothetical protein